MKYNNDNGILFTFFMLFNIVILEKALYDMVLNKNYHCLNGYPADPHVFKEQGANYSELRNSRP